MNAKVAEMLQAWKAAIQTPGKVDVDHLKPYIAKAYDAIGAPMPDIARMPSPKACMDVMSSRPEGLWRHFWQELVLESLPREDYWLQKLCLPKNRVGLLRQMHNHDGLLRQAHSSVLETIGGVENARLAVALHTNLPSVTLFKWACYAVTAELLGLPEKPFCLADVIASSYLFLPSRQLCLLCDKPVSKFDDRNRLHCENGPAVKFEDDSYYAWHGVFVPEKVILDPESQTAQEIQEETNQEVRRIRIERLGWLSYLQKIAAKTLDKRKNEIEGTNEALMDSPDGKILVCACPSTARIYALQVPQDVNSCQQAQNWLSGGLSKRVTAAT